MPGGVGQQPAVDPDHDDAAADVGRRGADDVAEVVVELAGDRRGHEVGLRAGLRLDLGVDAVAQAERERHLERDDREQQDVGEREQEAPAERQAGGHSHSSGAVKRKPTPRTVCR